MNKRIIWILIIPFLFQACSKKVITVLPTTPQTILQVQEIDFDYMQGKSKMTLRDGTKEREVKAHIRLRKDSVIWMNFTVVGVQGGRALINHDSITIISNVDKEYYVFEYAELSKRYNFEINFQVIQSAMLGNLLLPRKEDDLVESLSSVFLLKQKKNDIDIYNYVNAATMKLEKVELKESDTHNTFAINYANFQPLGEKLFPYNGTISLFYKTEAGLLNTTIIFEYNKAEIGDKELKFPFSIPKKYDRR
jgi:hypothetical protein